MELGTLEELITTRSVIKHIRKHDKQLMQGAGIGRDYATIGDALMTEAVGDTPYIAWVKAMNNMSVSGGHVIGVRIVLLLTPNTEEAAIKRYMSELNSYADRAGIQILGGHSEVSRAYNYDSFVVSAYGIREDAGYKPDVKAIKPDDLILMVGDAGLMGADMIARKRYDELISRFAPSYIRGAYYEREAYSIETGVRALMDVAGEHVRYMHDVSHGGVYGALWQLGVGINHVIEIDNFAIPIRQETIEIAEYFNINPYMLDGTGAFLAVLSCEEEKNRDSEDNLSLASEQEHGSLTDILDALHKQGITAACIGRVTATKDRVVRLGDMDNPEARYLSPIKGDEIYKVLPDLR